MLYHADRHAGKLQNPTKDHSVVSNPKTAEAIPLSPLMWRDKSIHIAGCKLTASKRECVHPLVIEIKKIHMSQQTK
jgi:hypothetical protein